MEKAVNDEKMLPKRLVITGQNEIRLQKYVEHHDVKSGNKHREKRDKV